MFVIFFFDFRISHVTRFYAGGLLVGLLRSPFFQSQSSRPEHSPLALSFVLRDGLNVVWVSPLPRPCVNSVASQPPLTCPFNTVPLPTLFFSLSVRSPVPPIFSRTSASMSFFPPFQRRFLFFYFARRSLSLSLPGQFFFQCCALFFLPLLSLNSGCPIEF